MGATGHAYAGGLVGRSRGVIAGSYARGAVTGRGVTSGRFGGLVGRSWYSESVVTNSYATGAVTGGGPNVANGGLVGNAVFSASGTRRRR